MINYNLQGLKIILIIINFRYNNYCRYYMNKKVIFLRCNIFLFYHGMLLLINNL